MELCFIYMITAVRLLNAQKWKGPVLPKMEEWLMKMMGLAEMAKLTSLIKEKTTSSFAADRKRLKDFCMKEGEK